MLRKMWSGQEVQEWLDALPPLQEVESEEKKFKDQFIVTFLSTWVANNYDDACIHSKHEMLNRPPVEDAEFLADKAWEEMQRLK